MDAPVHSLAFTNRRLLNWLPMGLAYAFLYMGRYNLTVAKNALGDVMTKSDFGTIFGVGALVYGVSFLINGPAVDRFGGRRGMLIGVMGALLANLAMGAVIYANGVLGWRLPVVGTFVVLYSLNMYFQSFGAVSIVTVKAPWFHVRERGTFSTIFGVIITLGIYFAFDWGHAIVSATRADASELGIVARAFAFVFGLGRSGVDENWMIFFLPAGLLGLFWCLMFLWLRNTPSAAGFRDFDTGEDSLSDDGGRLPVVEAIKRILSHPVLLFVCLIEFCSGVLRNGIMHWYTFFGKEVGFYDSFVITRNWGLFLLFCGLVGANATGWVSDRVFQSRRAPMSAILYALMVIATIALATGIAESLWIPAIAALSISMSVIAVHGIMAGTTTADFGGRSNTGIVVGIVDGFVYLGTGLQSFAIGRLAPEGSAAADPANWYGWPLFLIPFAVAGLLLTLRIWHALPSGRRGSPAANVKPRLRPKLDPGIAGR